jgi:cytochrome c
MKRMMICLALAAIVIGVAYVAYAGTAEDAKTLAQGAAAFIKQNGLQAGVTEIMKPDGKFRKGKLFLTANDFSGKMLASAAIPTLVGQNHYTLRDPNGKFFVQEAIEIAKTKGGGWLEYSFTDAETKKVVPRRAWVQRVEGMDVLVMAPFNIHK